MSQNLGNARARTNNKIGKNHNKPSQATHQKNQQLQQQRQATSLSDLEAPEPSINMVPHVQTVTKAYVLTFA